MLFRTVKVRDMKSVHKHCIIRSAQDTYIDAGSYGEVKKVYSRESKRYIAVKTIPLDITDVAFIDEPFGNKSLQFSSVWSEILFYRLMNLLIYNKVIPNFPIMYNWHYCTSCEIKSRSLQENLHRSVTECLYMEQELADGTLRELVKKYSKSLPEKYWYTIFFQIFAGVYAIRKYFNITHNDLHYCNVLYIKLQKDKGYIRYIIDNKKYYVPTFGYLFLIADFGLATIDKKVMSTSSRKQRHHLDDFYEILDIEPSCNQFLGRWFSRKKSLTPLRSAVKNLKDTIKYSRSEKDAVEKVGNELFSLPVKANEIIGTVNLNKKLKVPEVDSDLKKYIIG